MHKQKVTPALPAALQGKLFLHTTTFLSTPVHFFSQKTGQASVISIQPLQDK